MDEDATGGCENVEEALLQPFTATSGGFLAAACNGLRQWMARGVKRSKVVADGIPWLVDRIIMRGLNEHRRLLDAI